MILVDDARWPYRGGLWCHLISDASFDELHTFARSIGMPRIAFQGDHYDLDERHRSLAIEAGASAVDSRVIVRALKNAGLRRGPSFTSGGRAAVAHLPAATLTTERLLLRQWRPEDTDKLHALHTNPDVMRLLGGVLSRAETEAEIDRESVSLALRGFGRWAVERIDTGEFVGRVGISATNDVPIQPAVELGWRLDPAHQRNGYATEAAKSVLHYAHTHLEVNEVVAFTTLSNTASLSVIRRLGMQRVTEFDHPRLPIGHALRRHVLFRWTPDSAPETDRKAIR